MIPLAHTPAAMRKKVSIVPILSLDLEGQMRIRDLRNEESIRKWMYADHIISANEHLAWLHSLDGDESKAVFAIADENSECIGVVSLSQIDKVHLRADWAYYLSESARGGLGAAIEFCFIDFVFTKLGLFKLNCEVIEGNETVVKMHKKFLFAQEGVKRSNVVKSEDRKDVYLLGLTKSDWEAGKKSVLDRHGQIIERYDIIFDPIQIEASPPDAIDLITSARAKNNLNWMSILRLALEKSPKAAGPIVGEIRRIDREISALTDSLLEGN